MAWRESYYDEGANPSLQTPKEPVKPMPKQWDGRTARTSHMPSQTYSWYFTEDAKRKQGLKNEIDDVEIAAALKGIRNRWFDAVTKHRQIFEDYVGHRAKWSDIEQYARK